jgi:superfamily II DNA or RNA helicase
MQESHAAFSAGQQVIVRDERWAVLGTESFDVACLVKLRGLGPANRDELHSVLSPFDSVVDAAVPSRVQQRSRRSVLAAAAGAVADTARWDQCWTAANARIDLHAWQLEPAVAAVSGATRILLADAVGLGKTIQAALIISELSARGLADRVLVLTPASIREQWAEELTSRFGLRPTVFHQATLAAAATSLPPDVNPWATAPLIITSIDLVKRPEIRAALDVTPFDVLIIDEAHHLTPGSERAAVASDLAARIPWVVLATATPHSGDESAYEFLTSLGAAHDRLHIFRRAVPTSRHSQRRSRVAMVKPTAAERALLDATREYLRALRAYGCNSGARLVASVIARRAASSAAAAASTLARRAALLSQCDVDAEQPLLPWDAIDGVDDELTDSILAMRGLDDVQREIRWLQQMTDLARTAAATSSKIRVIRKLLMRTREQMIVFSEYRDVALQFARALEDVAAIAALHGGLSPRARRAAVQAFNTGEVRVLVATDAAGEGLNLHARCRLVVNVELPWMPLRLEQRIGRVDRLGQTRRVHAIHLAHRNSFEGTVIARLERRRTLTARPSEAVSARVDAHASRARRLRVHAQSAHPVPVYATRGRAGSAVMLLFVIPLVDGRAAIIQHDIVTVRVAVDSAGRLRRRTVRALARSSEIRSVIDQEALACVARARRVTTPAGHALEQRIDALLHRLEHRRAASLWQGSLFDRRREQIAGRNAAHVAALRAHLARRADTARQLRHVCAGEPQLVAAWLSIR